MIDDVENLSTPLRILLVEDHLVYRLGLRVIIEADPELEIVAEAEDGQQAISMAQRLKPDVIVMDVHMPILDGIATTKQLKSILPDCKVLMLTSHDGDGPLFAALAAGADGYCLKDTRSDSIRMAIRAISQGVGWLDPGIAKKVMLASSQPKPVAAAVAGVATAVRIDESGERKPMKFRLSSRELDVLDLVVQGKTNLQIAGQLMLSQDTIKTHMRNIMDKMTVADRTQMAVKAIREGLTT